MQSNKGRFKCPHEAQAVWNVFQAQVCNFFHVTSFEAGSDNGVKALEAFANDLHQARLIDGSVYDEHGRFEDKYIAYDIYHEFWGRLAGRILGTIFY